MINGVPKSLDRLAVSRTYQFGEDGQQDVGGGRVGRHLGDGGRHDADDEDDEERRQTLQTGQLLAQPQRQTRFLGRVRESETSAQ